MKIAYFDCFSGVSGDMTLGALLACDGADETRFREQLAALNVPGYELHITRVKREGITATDVDVRLLEVDQGHGRHLSDIAAILGNSTLPAKVKDNALAVFTRLADAEAKIHGTTRDEIHFHEVGAVDAIVDIVGSCILLDMLGVERVVDLAAAVRLRDNHLPARHHARSRPRHDGTAPGFPRPLRGHPGRTCHADGRGPGHNALRPGRRRTDARHDCPHQRLRGGQKAVHARHAESSARRHRRDRRTRLQDTTPQTVTVLETNLDDQSPETFELLMERALAPGALDIFFTPIQMKKNRPGTLDTVLCESQQRRRPGRPACSAKPARSASASGSRRASHWNAPGAPSPRLTVLSASRKAAGTAKSSRSPPNTKTAKPPLSQHNVPVRQVFQAALQSA